MLRFEVRFLFTILICGIVSAALRAQQKTGTMDDVVRTLFAGREFDETAISPDGTQVAWVEKLVDKNGVPNGTSAIYVSAVNGGSAQRQITAGSAGVSYAETAVAWSPDSKHLAFLSDAGSKDQQQLYVIDLPAGRARKLTNVKGFLDAPGWSPDGKILAVLFTENATRSAGPLVAETAQTGVIKDAVTEQRLTLIDAAGGKLRQISPADMYVYEYDWSADGKRFVTTAAHGNGDDNWYIAQIYTLDAAGGPMNSIYKPPIDSQIANPAWSPDGKTVAFISGIMSDEPAVGGDIFAVPASGGEARNVTPGMKASASWLTWTENGAKILFGEDIDGLSGIATVAIEGGKIESLYQDRGQLLANGWGTMVSLSADGKTAAAIRHSMANPPEIWTGNIVDWKQITTRNAAVKPGWGAMKSVQD